MKGSTITLIMGSTSFLCLPFVASGDRLDILTIGFVLLVLYEVERIREEARS